ncbi:MAG: DUF503 domain-containing protein [Gammaproteobacteria bacterium]|nr:DUF503 domain-containing protein [Gammaproteobacteria bacterium]
MASVNICLIVMTLHIPCAASLKDKRKQVKSLRERLQAKFNASVAEIDAHDEWQSAVLGITMISNDRRYLEAQFSAIEQLVMDYRDIELVNIRREWL